MLRTYATLAPILPSPPWRNRLARSAVNRKVGGSSPPGGAFLLQLNELFFIVRAYLYFFIENKNFRFEQF